MSRRIEHDIFGTVEKISKINSKKKGNRNELKAGKWLKSWTGLEFNRVPNSGGLRWRNAEGIVGDLVCEDKSFPLVIETKHYERLKLLGCLKKTNFVHKAYEQCLRDSERVNKYPMLMLRDNNMKAGEFIIFFCEDIGKLVNIDKCSYSDNESKHKLFGFNSTEFLEKINFKEFLKKLKK